MPPKRYAVAPAQRQSSKGYVNNMIGQITDPENRTTVTAITFFAVRHYRDDMSRRFKDEARPL